MVWEISTWETNKTNKLPSFVDRLCFFFVAFLVIIYMHRWSGEFVLFVQIELLSIFNDINYFENTYVKSNLSTSKV